jgi:HTH-type transcriptional regulator/antitoxin HipB
MFIRAPKELALMVYTQRKKLKLSQTEVADRVGLQQKTISAFENKPENTQLATLFSILSAVHLDINVLSKDGMGANDVTGWKEEW